MNVAISIGSGLLAATLLLGQGQEAPGPQGGGPQGGGQPTPSRSIFGGFGQSSSPQQNRPLFPWLSREDRPVMNKLQSWFGRKDQQEPPLGRQPVQQPTPIQTQPRGTVIIEGTPTSNPMVIPTNPTPLDFPKKLPSSSQNALPKELPAVSASAKPLPLPLQQTTLEIPNSGVKSPILPALLNFCDTNKVPLHFVAWHIYDSNPRDVRDTIDYVHGLLKQHPSLKPETFLDEWNMDLTNPPLDPRFQPCYIAETVWQMKGAGLDYSCYYHIRDWHVDFDVFAKFMSHDGVVFMTRWWNRMPQFDGLFDYQNTPRPSYFAFKLLSRLAGERLELTSSHSAVHGFATRDDQLRMFNVMLWNFSTNALFVGVSSDWK